MKKNIEILNSNLGWGCLASISGLCSCIFLLILVAGFFNILSIDLFETFDEYPSIGNAVFVGMLVASGGIGIASSATISARFKKNKTRTIIELSLPILILIFLAILNI